jgi:hypothetical protein
MMFYSCGCQLINYSVYHDHDDDCGVVLILPLLEAIVFISNM